jgi:methionyl-tRNA formyltransferase
MKIIFFGTPEFALPTLNALINSHHKVIAVVTQPDKQTGRGKKLAFSPVKELALKHNIPVLQYVKIRRDGVDELKTFNADIFVTCAYGQILSKDILDMTKYGVFNVHGSMLPKYRGSSPVQWSIINGEKTTGITILKSDVGIDDGPIILQKQVEILNNETSEELFNRLSLLGAECLIEALTKIENGTITYTQQNHSQATVCKMLNKELSIINFNESATKNVNLINGINVWPTAEIKLNIYNLKLFKASLLSDNKKQFLKDINNYKNGEVVLSSAKQGLVLKSKDGFVEILELQAENSKRMNAKSFLNGKSISVGSVANE